jgi:hypothetical protein
LIAGAVYEEGAWKKRKQKRFAKMFD